MLYALAALLAHLLTAGRYGYFRDELYFIACSKHPALGYVDQPPLVAVAAGLSAPFSYNLVALRVLPAIAAAFTVWLSAAIAKELGGGRFAQSIAALTTFLLPAYLLLGNTLTTTSFEPFSWTLLMYALIRVQRDSDPRFWPLAGAAFVIGMYAKYSMLLFALSILIALLCTPTRALLKGRWFWFTVFASLLALLPNVLWQAAHDWPFAQVVAGDFAHRHAFQTGVTLEYTAFWQNAGAFLIEQLIYTNPLSIVLWLGGALYLALSDRVRAYRFIAIAFAVLMLFAILLEAKGYYIVGAYATLLAAGGVAFGDIVRRPQVRALIAAPILLAGLTIAPIALPVLPVDALIEYTRQLHLSGNGASARLIQPVFAEEFGWDGLAGAVAKVYRTLPREQRAATAVYADTYGDAGALDFFGRKYGLPPAISSQNSYYLWGPRGYDGKTMIVVGATQIERIRRLYRNVRLIATYADRYKWAVEGPDPIYLCTRPVAPLPVIWPQLRWYGA